MNDHATNVAAQQFLFQWKYEHGFDKVWPAFPHIHSHKRANERLTGSSRSTVWFRVGTFAMPCLPSRNLISRFNLASFCCYCVDEVDFFCFCLFVLFTHLPTPYTSGAQAGELCGSSIRFFFQSYYTSK